MLQLNEFLVYAELMSKKLILAVALMVYDSEYITVSPDTSPISLRDDSIFCNNQADPFSLLLTNCVCTLISKLQAVLDLIRVFQIFLWRELELRDWSLSH